LVLGGCQHAVQPAQHRHGQHDLAVLWRTVGAAQFVGDFKDEVDQVSGIGGHQCSARSLGLWMSVSESMNSVTLLHNARVIGASLRASLLTRLLSESTLRFFLQNHGLLLNLPRFLVCIQPQSH